jgi:arginase
VRGCSLAGDADLTSPQTTRSGILDAMGIAHLIGAADTELARLDRPAPMIADERLVLIGYDADDPEAFDGALLARHRGVRAFSGPDVAAAANRVARDAVSAMQGAQAVIVHFDVDAVDSGDLPLGNLPHYGTGVTLDVAAQVLRTLCSAPALTAVALTEVNPSYDPDGRQLARYVDAVTAAIGSGLLDR